MSIISRLKLHQQLLLKAGGLILCIYLAFISINFYQSVDNARSRIFEKELPDTSYKVKSLLKETLAKPEQFVKASATNQFLIDWMQSDMSNQEPLLKLLEKIENVNGFFSTVVVSHRNKNIYKPTGIHENIADQPQDYWYYEAIRQPNEMIYHLAAPKYNEGEFSLFVDHKIRNDEGELLGLTGYGIGLSQLTENILKLQMGEKGRITLVSQEGKKLIYPLELNQEEGFEKNLFQDKEYAAKAQSMLSKKDGQYELSRNGETYLAQVTFLPELGWYIINEASEQELLSPVYSKYFLRMGLELLVFLLMGLYVYYILKNTAKPISTIAKLAEEVKDGKLDDLPAIETSSQEIDQLHNSFQALTQNLKKTSSFAREIENGNLQADFEASGAHDELGKALMSMREGLLKVEQEEKRRHWANEGIAHFAQLLRKDHKGLEEMASDLITELVKQLNANQGAFIVLRERETEKYLEMVGCYAYNRKKFLNKRFEIGEGLVGQAYLEQDTIYLTDVPQDYINITSGLGKALPRHVLLVPVKNNEKVLGILELASFNAIEAYQREFVEKVSEAIAASLAMFGNSRLTEKLLEETQSQAEQLRTQEDEMRSMLQDLFAEKQDLELEVETYKDEIEALKMQIDEIEKNSSTIK